MTVTGGKNPESGGREEPAVGPSTPSGTVNEPGRADSPAGCREEDPDLHLVELVLCALCMNGEGGTCWTPGCALWCNTSPDVSLWDNPACRRIERC